MAANKLRCIFMEPVTARFTYPNGEVKVKQFIYEKNIVDAEKLGIEVEILDKEKTGEE